MYYTDKCDTFPYRVNERATDRPKNKKRKTKDSDWIECYTKNASIRAQLNEIIFAIFAQPKKRRELNQNVLIKRDVII